MSCLDGWTKADLVYVWKDEGALQFADNLTMPGGFILDTTGNQYCDVKTATGKILYNKSVQNLILFLKYSFQLGESLDVYCAYVIIESPLNNKIASKQLLSPLSIYLKTLSC